MVLMLTRTETILANLTAHEQALHDTLRELATHYASIIESDAQANAPWQDQTGAARRGLRAKVETETNMVRLWLSHGVDYGIYLETRDAGRLAILWPTLERRGPEIMAALQATFGG